MVLVVFFHLKTQHSNNHDKKNRSNHMSVLNSTASFKIILPSIKIAKLFFLKIQKCN